MVRRDASLDYIGILVQEVDKDGRSSKRSHSSARTRQAGL